MKVKIPQLSTENAIHFCSTLHDMDYDDHYYFDVSEVSNYEPFPMLLTAAAIRQFKESWDWIGCDYQLRYNDDKNFSYACHMGYFKSAGFPFGNDPGEASGSSTYIPLKKINVNDWMKAAIDVGDYSDQVDIIEKESKKLAWVLGQQNNELAKLFQYLIREAIRNVPEHADTDEFWICGQYWGNRSGKPAEIAILDEGCGILKSLQKNRNHRKYISNNEEALRWAVKPGVSASFDPARGNKADNPNGNSGYGLFIISEICKLTNGRMTLLSNDNCLRIFPNSISMQGTNFHGTAIGIRINTDGIHGYQQLIDKARRQGEKTAKNIKHAFKEASVPSKGLLL